MVEPNRESNAVTSKRVEEFFEWLHAREENVIVIVAHSCISKYLWEIESAKKTAGWCNHFPQNAPAAYILHLHPGAKRLKWQRTLTKSLPLTSTDMTDVIAEPRSKLVVYIRHAQSQANAARRADRKRAKAEKGKEKENKAKKENKQNKKNTEKKVIKKKKVNKENKEKKAERYKSKTGR